jgi:ABC-type sugar transport system permease subunit
MAVAAYTTMWTRRRRLTWARVGRSSVPYLLILPVVAALAAILGYPIYSLVRLSLEHYTLFELIRHQGQWIGLKNFSSVLQDQVFWHTVLRTVIFTVVNVGRRSLPCRCGTG